MNNTKLIILSNLKDRPLEKDINYLTFSKTMFCKYENNYNIKYFFDISPNINEPIELESLESNLFIESKKESNRWFVLSFKFIYKYLLTYNQFYNRLRQYLNSNENIKSLEISSKISFILNLVIDNISQAHNIKIIKNNKDFDNFSYRHSQFMGSDIPDHLNLDKYNIFLYIHALYLRFTNHNIFIFPSSFISKMPFKVNIFRISIFTIYSKIKRKFGFQKNKKYLCYIPIIDFSEKPEIRYNLDKKIWSGYRNDQLELIQNIINVFFSAYKYEYIDNLKNKVTLYLKASKTKKVILDETIDSFRRLICLICRENSISIEFTPHGIIDEDLQFPLTNNQNYSDKYIPDILTWNSESATYLSNKGLKCRPISYPLALYPYKPDDKKDILVMLSYGDRVNLNAFEEYIIDIIPLAKDKNYSIDWKIHKNIFEDSNISMKQQKENIENEYNVNINLIPHDINASSILKNYKTIIFTTWTTGIYEAAMLNIPFVIYTKENETIRALESISIPVAENIHHLYQLIGDSDVRYLNQIKESLTKNLSLSSYLSN